MVAWFRLAAMVDRQMDRSWSEPVRLSFLIGGAVDQSRPPVEIRAILETFDGSQTDLDGGNSQRWQTRLEAGRARLRIHRANHPMLMLAEGDAVKALARPGQPWFVVLSVNDRDETHIVAELGEK